MSDRIFITGLMLHPYHGVMAHEAKVGQTFGIDIELDVDLSAAARSDKVADTVSYDKVVKCASDAFLKQRFVDWGLPAEKIQLVKYGRSLAACPVVGAQPRKRTRFGYFGQINAFKGVTVAPEGHGPAREGARPEGHQCAEAVGPRGQPRVQGESF